MNVSRSEMGGGSAAAADWRELDTTPEFREFVGKKLDQLVSGMIKEKDRCKHLQPAAEEEEGGVQLFAGAPPLQVAEEGPQEPPTPAKRPKLAGVDLQRYQLKKKSRRERDAASDGGKKPGRQTDTASAADTADDAKPASPSAENGTAVGGKKESDGGGSSDSDSDDEDMARFAEAAVSADFMTSLAKSKTVKLDSA